MFKKVWPFAAIALGVLGAIALLDPLLARTVQDSGLAKDIVDIQTPSILFAKLDYLRKFKGFKVVLLGDSLIYGETLWAHGDAQWREHNLATLLEQAIRTERPGQEVLVMNLGINGAVPADLEKLARLVVCCQVDWVVLDIHLRPFSADFGEPKMQLTRPWLKNVSMESQGYFSVSAPGNDVLASMQEGISNAFLNYWTTYRVRELIQERLFGSQLVASAQQARKHLASGSKTTTTPSDDEALIRLLQLQNRLSSVSFSENNPQRQAFERLLSYLREQQQQTLIFYAKENPALLGTVMEQGRYQQLSRDLEAVIASQSTQQIRYMPPVKELQPNHYLDFSHLNYAGYQVLTRYLLKEMAANRR